MKLRIKGNSLRIRLTKTEIANFDRQGFIEEKTEFINGAVFSYILQRKKGIENLEAEFSNNQITMFVPEKIALQWTSTDVVGFNDTMNLGNSKQLMLLIEKDWVCLDNPLEDQSDNFPNPKNVC